MKKISDNFVRIDDFLALCVANCRDENKIYVINGVSFQWKRKLFSFIVNGVQKPAATVYAELACDFSKLGKVSFIEYMKY